MTNIGVQFSTPGIYNMGGAYNPVWMNNIAIVRATTTNAGDSIKITGFNATALSATNPGSITLPSTVTAGLLVNFQVTADVTILLTGAHWGIGTTGDITGGLLRVLAINDNATLRWGVAYLGGRNTILTTDSNATPTNINLPEEVLATSAVASASNTCREVGFVRANFDDTGGAAEDLWAIQTGLNDVVTGQSVDGLWQPYNFALTGTTTDATPGSGLWTQIGRQIFISNDTGNRTSNSTAFAFLGPAKSRRSSYYAIIYAFDNGSVITTPCIAVTNVDSTSIDLYQSPSLGIWTAANRKEVVGVNLDYEVGPAASFIE